MANSGYTESLAPYGTSHSGSTLSADLTAAFRHNIVPIQAVGSPVKDQNTMNTYFRNGLGKSPVFCNISSIIPCPWGKMRGKTEQDAPYCFFTQKTSLPSENPPPHPLHMLLQHNWSRHPTHKAGLFRANLQLMPEAHPCCAQHGEKVKGGK